MTTSRASLPFTTGPITTAASSPPIAVTSDGIILAGCWCTLMTAVSSGSMNFLTREGTMSVFGASLTCPPLQIHDQIEPKRLPYWGCARAFPGTVGAFVGALGGGTLGGVLDGVNWPHSGVSACADIRVISGRAVAIFPI